MKPRFRFQVGLWLFLCLGCYSDAFAEFLKIQGIPIEIRSNEYGTMGIYLNNGTGTLQQQYFGGDDGTGTVLRFEGEAGTSTPPYTFVSDRSYLSGYGALLTPVSHDKPDAFTIVTVTDVGTTGLHVKLTITYTNGDAYYKKVWEISNTGNTIYNNLKLLHGGDTYFAEDDYSEGHWDPSLRMVYLTNSTIANFTGIMGFFGGAASPADAYYEDYYYSVWTAMGNASLPNSVNSSYHDAGYALQWNKAQLGPGQVWKIEAFEKWTDAGLLQVVAPEGQAAAPGQVVEYAFTLSNYTSSTVTTDDTFSLALSSSKGWNTTLPNGRTITIPSRGSGVVPVRLTVPQNAVLGDTDTLTLTATSVADSTIHNSDSVTTTIGSVLKYTLIGDVNNSGAADVGDYHLIGVPGAVPINGDAFSVFGPNANYGPDVRIFQYHNGATVEYSQGTGANPVASVTPGEGYWVISEVTRDLNIPALPLSPSEEVSVTLSPGWNIVGYPYDTAMSLSNVTVNGTPIGQQSLVETQAWAYHAGYAPVVTAGLLEGWNAYWFKNISSSPATLAFPRYWTQLGISANVVKSLSSAPVRRGLAFTIGEKGAKYKDRTLFLGLHSKAANGPDMQDASSPPGLTGLYPKIYVDHTKDWTTRRGKYSTDMRKLGIYPQRYNLVVETPQRRVLSRYVLKWQGVGTLPPYRKAFLTDVLKGRTVDMGSRQEYEVVVPSGLKAYKLQVTIR